MITVQLPLSVQDSLSQKYGHAAIQSTTLTRTLSFERDVTVVEEPSYDVERVRAVVCISDHMPPRPTLGIARDRYRNILNCTPDGDDLTTVMFESVPHALSSLALRMCVPRAAIWFEGRNRYRAVSLLDASTTLCVASDVRVARVIVAMSMLDEHIPPSHLTNALRQFMTNARLLRKWISSVDPESVTCVA